MKEISTRSIQNCNVNVPGSKSYSHRMLIASALASGDSRVSNLLISEDTELTASALSQVGIGIQIEGTNAAVAGLGGQFKPTGSDIYLGNAGTSMRLLTGIMALGDGPYTLTGTKRMQERPIEPLLSGLREIGVRAESVNKTGCPPVMIDGNGFSGDKMTLDCRISSQFLSSVLMMAPCRKSDLTVTVAPDLVSKPYVDLTIDIMNQFGVSVSHNDYKEFFVPGGQSYEAGNYTVESDGSQASYFWAAAAVTGRSIRVNGVTAQSRQGDVGFADVLGQMGCVVSKTDDGITVTGGELVAVDVDMGHMPDVVPTLAVVAAFAKGKTVIRNVAHLRDKECDRLGCVATELRKMGIDALDTAAGLEITGGKPKGAEIQTYDDHRMAMSFAVAGLKAEGVKIIDPDCVVKSFPNYWDVFEGLYA